MKIYKYKNLPNNPDKEALQRLYQIILEKKVWCSNLKKLNDPDEFKFRPDCTPDKDTEILLNMLLTKKDRTQAVGLPGTILDKEGYLQKNAEPIINGMIDKVRRELGLACFSLARNNSAMWERYGGNGNGVCIEIDVPDDTPDLRKVNYVKEKIIPINVLIDSALGGDKTEDVYRDMLCTKTEKWQAEKEVRFVINLPVIERQNRKIHRRGRGQKKRPDGVLMHITGSFITEVVFGNTVEVGILNKMKTDIEKHPNGGSILLMQPE